MDQLKFSKCSHLSCALAPQICSFHASHWSRDGLPPDQAIARFVKSCASSTKQARESIPCLLDVKYGDVNHSAIQPEANNDKVDFYGFDVLPENAPTFLFVHGGLWVEGSKNISAPMATGLTSAGVKVAVLGYNLTPSVSLSQIVDEIATGIEFVVARILDSAGWEGVGDVYVSGHSAGGHLVAMALVRLRHRQSAALRHIRGAFLLSGIYDVQTFADSKPEAHDLGLTSSGDVESCSPGRFVDEWVDLVRMFPVWIIYGQYEPKAYIDHAESFYSALCKKMETCDSEISNKRLRKIVIEGVDHLELVERMDNEKYELVQLIINSMK